MADSTLGAIQTKVRRLTRTPSEAQLTTPQIDEYVNTFILYDFPEHLRLFSLRTTLTFYTQPNVDVYSTNTLNINDPLYNFKNIYTSVHDPVYIGGYQCLYSQSRTNFFGIYPFINFINQIDTGDGVTTVFAGNLNSNMLPILQNNVTIYSVDATNTALIVTDVPMSSMLGNLVIPDNTTVVGSVNYLTGAYNFTFPTAPAAQAIINSSTVPYVAARPQALLFYDDMFTIRPVPDQTYPVNLEVYIRPTELLSSNQSPQLEQWWQYIAYGAAKKIFEDRMDMESVQMIMPEFEMQALMVLRKTILEQSNERVSTIYTQQSQLGVDGYGFGFGNSPF